MTSEELIGPVVGGLMIGTAASAMLLLKGRVAGISGILGGALTGERQPWRFAFLLGLLAGGAVLALAKPSVFAVPSGRSLPVVALAGVLVGLGTRLGNGCTSGHGVCGVGRMSKRSVAATLTFMATGAATASLMHIAGGTG